MTNSRHWADHTSEQLARLDRARVVAVLPIGAVEQHGPHLPLCTDFTLATAIVDATVALLGDDLPVLVLPPLAYGKSNEHAAFPGTLTLSTTTLLALWSDIGASVARAGVRKLVLFNAHGGHTGAMELVARDLRERHAMLVVTATWLELGLPAGLFDDDEVELGIHGGDVETSAMLALAPQHVRSDRAKRFEHLGERMARGQRRLGVSGAARFGWQAQDLNPEGACGDASRASADKGRALIAHAAARLAELLHEVDGFDLARLAQPPAWR